MDGFEHDNMLDLFVEEAGEIVQQLSGQLDELHYGYDGERILDDIHRGFHTLKGGAAVVGGLEPLVECSTLAEQIMDSLRTKRLALNPGLVSLLGSALTAVEAQVREVEASGAISPLADELRQRLIKAAGRTPEEHPKQDRRKQTRPAVEVGVKGADPLDLFFGDLSAAGDRADSDVAVEASGNATISDDEFESLLDSLYGEGKGPTPSLESFSQEVLAESAESSVPDNAPLALADEAGDAGSALRDDQIRNLIKELAWVRSRLMRLHTLRSREDLEKALSYLDLVTRDMERWLREGDQ